MVSLKLVVVAVLAVATVAQCEEMKCKDFSIWCKYHSRYGACSWNEDTQKTCPRTCGKCSVECSISNGDQRQDCGYLGIQRDECYTKGCCWDPLPQGQNGPWCYKSSSNIVQ